MRHAIGPDDLIAIVGGGNTGDSYDDIEFLRQLIIRRFPDSAIVSFPQSVEFSAGLSGWLAARAAKRAYGGHPRLTLIARDAASQAAYMQLLPNMRIGLAPDVVLTMSERQPARTRDGVVMTLRDDRERGLSFEDRKTLMQIAEEIGTVTSQDTHLGDGQVSIEAGEIGLQEIWDVYRSAELVVTDRLHGMIFAVITGTPCIAIDSSNFKVGNFYDAWLADVEGVHMLRQFDPTSFRTALAHLSEMPPADTLDHYSAATKRMLRKELEAWRPCSVPAERS
jgi:pyruvyl transferase EpsI